MTGRRNTVLTRMFMGRNGYGKFVLAAVLYAAFAIELFWQRFDRLERWEWLLPLNVCAAALGSYVLSRRWVSSFAGSFFAGAVYGFGPFMLGLGRFQPTAGSLAAAIPWLFCPAVFGGKTKWRRNSSLLAILPFAAIVLYFQACKHYGLFPVPIQIKPDLVSLFAPMVVAELNRSSTALIGFYHIPIAPLIMGCAMLLAARRMHIVAVIVVGTALALCKPILGVSPIIWLAVPTLCCSVLIGVGVQGLTLAGPADRKWLIAAAGVMATLAITALFLATKYFQVVLNLGDKYARLFVQTAEMYVLGAVALAVLFFMARARLRSPVLRQTLLYVSMALDIFLTAGFTIARVL